MQTVLSSSLIQGGIPLLLLSLASAEALPTGLSEPVYVPNPTGRGTVGLLTSCVLTLFLCVWTAIHINVFPKSISGAIRTMWKAVWAGLALLAPEFVLWTAMTQFDIAREFRNTRNTILRMVLMEKHKLIGKDLEDANFLQAGWLRHG